MDKRIGAQLYTVRNLCQTQQGFENTLRRLHEIGYKVVQISGIGDFPAQTVRALCDTYRMTVACVHWDLIDFETRLSEIIEYQKTVGSAIAGMSYIPPENRCSFDAIQDLVQRMNRIHDHLTAHGLQFAHHNHAYEFARYDGQRAMDYMLEHGKFGFIVDVYWLAFAGIHPAEFLRKIGTRCTVLHYKDLAVTNQNTVEYAPIGCGNLDWDSIFAASENAAFALVEQDECHGDPLECLETSYRFLAAKGFQ